MALLGATSLIDCLYIPGFIASGTKMIFENSTSPVSWTKDTTVSEGTLRVVNGTAASGGSITFSQAFSASKPISGSTSPVASSWLVAPAVSTQSLAIGNASIWSTPTTTSANSLSIDQITTHTHTYSNASGSTSTSPAVPQITDFLRSDFTNSTGTFAPEGSGQGHSHSVPQVPHAHTVPAASLNHGHQIDFPHSHTVSSTENFSVLYVDVIISTKD